MGLSPQRRLVRAYEKDPETAQRWREEEYPKIAAAAKKARARIFFCDEAGVRTDKAGVRTDHHAGTTWGEVGRTPVARGTGQRRSLNMISAISPLGELHFTFAGRVSSDSFIEYLKRLLDDVPGKILLVLDGRSAHSSTKTKEFVASTKGRLSLFYLPPCSPELDPDGWVWHNLKHDPVAKMAARSLEETKAGIEKAVARLQGRREIVLGFLRSPDLGHIKA